MGPSLVESNTTGALNSTSFRQFWISWSDGVIRCGSGHAIGKDVLVEFNDTTPSDVNYVSLSGLYQPGIVIIAYGMQSLVRLP